MKIDLKIEFILNNDVKITQKHIKLLQQIAIDKSISKAAKNLDMSYKNAWDSLNEINKNSDEELFLSNSRKEGTKLSNFAKEILKKYDEFNIFKSKINSDFSYKISAQNKIKAKIVEISSRNNFINLVCSKNNELININISKDALNELDLKINDEICLIFKINFVEIESDGENSFLGKIIKLQENEKYLYIDLDFQNETIKAVIDKNKLQKTYKIDDFIRFKIPAKKIIVSL